MMMRMRHMRRFAALVAAVLGMMFCCMGAAETGPSNPLVTPLIRVADTDTPERLRNILLLGIDLGEDGYWGSYRKKRLSDCHTDAVMVLSVNMTTGHVNLVSLPRDTLCYVPRVRGVYKLNAAINCADNVEDGIRNTVNTARWLLGGVEIDDYVALDMPAMIALGDAVGGVDMELEMAYTGSSGRYYRKGFQHLDGTGIMDYSRARVNATVNYNDLGRTNRQRKTVKALTEKLKGQPNLIKQAWDLIDDGKHNILTSLKLGDVLNLAAIADKSQDEIGVYVLEGSYRSALRGWNFTFTDQQHRLEVLREAFGIEAEEIPYVSQSYCDWLTEQGFRMAHALNMAQPVLEYAAGLSGLTEEQLAARDRLDEAYGAAAAAFDRAADAQSAEADREMNQCRTALTKACDAAASALGYPGRIGWNGWYYWFTDSFVNEYPDITWQ